MKSKNIKTKLEGALEMASDWFVNSKEQEDTGNAYVSLAIALECIYAGPNDDVRTITSAIAEGLAFALGNNKEERGDLYRNAKKIYAKRSKIAHGVNREVSFDDLKSLSDLVESSIRFFLSKIDVWSERNDFIKHVDNIKFEG